MNFGWGVSWSRSWESGTQTSSMQCFCDPRFALMDIWAFLQLRYPAVNFQAVFDERWQGSNFPKETVCWFKQKYIDNDFHCAAVNCGTPKPVKISTSAYLHHRIWGQKSIMWLKSWGSLECLRKLVIRFSTGNIFCNVNEATFGIDNVEAVGIWCVFKRANWKIESGSIFTG